MDNMVKRIRRFNRFYTAHIGLLNRYYLQSRYSLTEGRLIYEIGERGTVTAQELSELLRLDKGYLSRLLKQFTDDGIVSKSRSSEDGRMYWIGLTDKGRAILADLQTQSERQIAGIIRALGPQEQELLVGAMDTVQRLLSAGYDKQLLAREVTLREELRPGDIGYLIHLHGDLYARESGLSLDFESYVLKTFHELMENYSPEKDRIWLAEYQQRIIGCVAVLTRPDNEAQLRWFLVHPAFRGTGVGRRLLDAALAHSRAKGFDNLYLWTTSLQQQAVAIYQKLGFKQTAAVERQLWGHQLNELRFDLPLRDNHAHG